MPHGRLVVGQVNAKQQLTQNLKLLHFLIIFLSLNKKNTVTVHCSLAEYKTLNIKEILITK